MFLGSNIFHSHIWVTARSNFLQPSIYFLSSFQDNEHHFVRVGTTILSLNYPNTITQVKFRCKNFFCFISVVWTEHLVENLVFYSLKKQHVPNFRIIEEENVTSLQGYTIITWSNKFLLIFSYSSVKLVVQVTIENYKDL